MATQLQGSWRTCESSRHTATPDTIRALLGRRQNGVEEQCGSTDPWLMRKGDSVWGSPTATELERARWRGNHAKVSPPGRGLQAPGTV